MNAKRHETEASMKPAFFLHGLLALALVLVGLTPFGCFLESGDETTVIPTDEGDTFQIRTDDVGLVAETDEANAPTGRFGQVIDLDRDCRVGKDGTLAENCKDEFYQIPYPKVGVFGLGFDPVTGMGNAAQTLGIIDMVPGQTHYKLPLKPITAWIHVGDVDKAIRGKTDDDLSRIFFVDPVTGEVGEGLLTGVTRKAVWNALSGGLVTLVPRGGDDDDSAIDDDTGNEKADDDTSDDDTGGDDDTVPDGLTCETYPLVCEREEQCGLFEGDWTVDQCQTWMANHWRSSDMRRYMNCTVDCLAETTCDRFTACRKTCFDSKTFDQFGCDGKHAPEITDVIYLVDDGKAGARFGNGDTIKDDARVGIYFQYRDVEGDFEGGRLMVRFDGGTFAEAAAIDVPLGENSFASGVVYGFSLATPIPQGQHTFEAYFEDACGLAGNVVDGRFTVEGGAGTANVEKFSGKIGTSQAEYYETKLNKYNEGKGLLAVEALDPKFFYNIEGIDVALLQCYIWLVQSPSDSSDYDYQAINYAILASTMTDGGTKYDGSDDSQASIFNFDEPMTAGVLLIWGDKGWNLFPTGPYGNNDVNFIRGDWARDEIYVPTAPIYSVEEKYKGATDNCAYWVDFIYRDPEVSGGEPDLHTGLGLTLKKSSGADLSINDAYELCRVSSANAYWNCVLGCAKREQDPAFDLQRDSDAENPNASRRCIDPGACIDACRWDNVGETYREAGAKPLSLKVNVEIPSYYLKKASHLKTLRNADRSLKVGVYVRGAGLVPGAYVDFNPNRRNYTVPLPYGDTIPNSFFAVNKISNAQIQALPALVTHREGAASDQLWGSSYNEPNTLYAKNWYWLIIYSYHWVTPVLEGWTLYSVEPPYLQDVFDIRSKSVVVRYGDLRAVDGGIVR
jgi:hypothetical protein